VPAPGSRPRAIGIWLAATRPKTLAAGCAPVLVGAALGSTATHTVMVLPAIACLAAALLIQIGCNFANDAFDALSGADTDQRQGPRRAVAAGLISARAMLIASALVLALAFAVGLYLAALGGWPLLALGLISIICAIAYTGGPFPLAYHGLGDVFVFVFFGLLATLGTAWVQLAPALAETATIVRAPPLLLAMPLWWWLSAAALGAQATAILVVNNVRDISTDAVAGKRTLAVRMGRTMSILYLGCLHLGAAAALAAATLCGGPRGLLAAAILACLAGGSLTRSVAQRHGPALNILLAKTALLELLTATVVVIACLAS
jgi:1,4-dihydroxy-2-naphthoate octaprenyltransferase